MPTADSIVESTEPDHFDLCIGVGCLWFAPAEADFESAEQHFRQIENALSSIENLTNLSCTGSDGKYGDIVAFVEDDDEFPYPNVYWVKISFDILISDKVQEKLDARCGVEKFSVYIENHYHTPVTYAYSSEVDAGFDGSTAIILLRRYLEEKMADYDVKFGVIGPSPFHARFYTVGAEQTSLVRLPTGVGYVDYAFEYERDDDGGLRAFADRHGDVLSLFYQLHNMRRRSLRLQERILRESRTLIEGAKTQGWWSQIWKPVAHGKTHDSISEDVLTDQLCRDHMVHLLAQAAESEDSGEFIDLESHFRELKRFSREMPYSRAIDIVKTSELRRQNLLTNVAVLVAGLFGGIIGALLGSLLTYALTTRVVAPSAIEKEAGAANSVNADRIKVTDQSRQPAHTVSQTALDGPVAENNAKQR